MYMLFDIVIVWYINVYVYVILCSFLFFVWYILFCVVFLFFVWYMLFCVVFMFFVYFLYMEYYVN